VKSLEACNSQHHQVSTLAQAEGKHVWSSVSASLSQDHNVDFKDIAKSRSYCYIQAVAHVRLHAMRTFVLHRSLVQSNRSLIDAHSTLLPLFCGCPLLPTWLPPSPLPYSWRYGPSLLLAELAPPIPDSKKKGITIKRIPPSSAVSLHARMSRTSCTRRASRKQEMSAHATPREYA
jgi:hypothetical protein